MEIQVESYSGYRGEETPRSIQMGSRRIRVEKILDRWLSPDHRYFKIRADDNGVYIIRHDSESWKWEIVFFQQVEKFD